MLFHPMSFWHCLSITHLILHVCTSFSCSKSTNAQVRSAVLVQFMTMSIGPPLAYEHLLLFHLIQPHSPRNWLEPPTSCGQLRNSYLFYFNFLKISHSHPTIYIHTLWYLFQAQREINFCIAHSPGLHLPLYERARIFQLFPSSRVVFVSLFPLTHSLKQTQVSYSWSQSIPERIKTNA